MVEVSLPKVLGRSSDLCCVVAVLLFAAAVKTKRLRTNRGAAARPLPGPLFLAALVASSISQALPLFVAEDNSVKKLVKLYNKLQRKAGTEVSHVNVVLHILTTDASAFQLMLRAFFLVMSLTMLLSTLTGMLTPSSLPGARDGKPTKAETKAAAVKSPIPGWLKKLWPSVFLAGTVALLATTVKACADDGTLSEMPEGIDEFAKIVRKCLPRQSGPTAMVELLAIGPQMFFIDDAFSHGIALRFVACALLLWAWYALGQLDLETFMALAAVSKLQRICVAAQALCLGALFLPVYLKRNYSVVLGLVGFAVLFAGLWIAVSEGLPSVQAALGTYGDTGNIIKNALSSMELQRYDTMTIADGYRYLSVFSVACVLCSAIVGGSTALMVTLGVAGLLSNVHFQLDA